MAIDLGAMVNRNNHKRKIHGIYWVAFKILLKRGGKYLFVKTSQKGLLDLPGGRADSDEGKVPIKKILEREVREELGDKVKYRLAGPVLQYRRYSQKYKIYVLITAYRAEYVSGPIVLSTEHKNYEWLDPKICKFEEKNFTSKEACESFREYFSGHKTKIVL
jgi:8-oxo-dGTP pyrophosphatase MutT (NUDIX family)